MVPHLGRIIDNSDKGGFDTSNKLFVILQMILSFIVACKIKRCIRIVYATISLIDELIRNLLKALNLCFL